MAIFFGGGGGGGVRIAWNLLDFPLVRRSWFLYFGPSYLWTDRFNLLTPAAHVPGNYVFHRWNCEKRECAYICIIVQTAHLEVLPVAI